MSAYSPPSLNAVSDEENPAKLDEESPAQLEQPLNPPTSQAPFGTAKWVVPAHDVSSQGSTIVRATTVPATNTATDLPICKKRILFVWMCLTTLNCSKYLIFYLLYIVLGVANILFSKANKEYGQTLIALVGSALIVWAVVSMWKAYGKREYRLVLFLSIVLALFVSIP